MRHGTNLLASMEGMSRTAFLIVQELSQAGRSGLTPALLAKKLEIPQEEVEYFVDVHHGVMYTNLTRICLSSGGLGLARRVQGGLASRGDASFLLEHVRALGDAALQRLEERLGLDGSASKTALALAVLHLLYKTPATIETHIRTGAYSPLARSIFQRLLESDTGSIRMETLRHEFAAGSTALEAALQELISDYVLFEKFRFDDEGFLYRSFSLLQELRDFLFSGNDERPAAADMPPPHKGVIEEQRSEGMCFTDLLGRITAAIAARPCRIRKGSTSLDSDAALFKEDRARLEEIISEDHDPPLRAFMDAAYQLGWIKNTDNLCVVCDVAPLLEFSLLERHRLVVRRLTGGQHASDYGLLIRASATMQPEQWYSIHDFARFALSQDDSTGTYALRRTDTGYAYVAPQPARMRYETLCRLLSQHLTWLGLVERCYCDGEACFRVSALGRRLFSDPPSAGHAEGYSVSSGTLVVQPNFEIMAALEQMDPLRTIPLHIFAETDGKGSVGVFRLTRERFMRALQQGHDPAAFLAFLKENSRSPLPENVVITLEDWLRSAKRIRLRTYHVIESDDPMVIAELAHHRKWNGHFTAVNEKKLLRYEGLTRQALEEELEKDGYIIR